MLNPPEGEVNTVNLKHTSRSSTDTSVENHNTLLFTFYIRSTNFFSGAPRSILLSVRIQKSVLEGERMCVRNENL